MKKDNGKLLYELFCESIKEVMPKQATFSWAALGKDQKLTWDILQQKLDQQKSELKQKEN